MYKLETKKPSILILITLISSASVGAVLFTPGLPAIIKDFGVSPGVGQLALTLFLIGYALGQLLYAPLANRWGRKPTLYIGMSVGIIGSLFAGLAGPLHSFSLLLIARFVMAVGSSVGLVLTFTIINDFFYEHQARKVVPFVSLAFGAMPFIGVTIGGFLVHYVNWESTFYFLMVYNFMLLLLSICLPETATSFDPTATKFRNILKKYRMGFSDQRIVTYSILFGLTTIVVYLFAASAPLIVINELKVAPDIYGSLNLIVAAGYTLGNLSSAWISKHLEARTTMKLGYTIFGLGIVTFAFFFLTGMANLYSLYIPFFFAYFGLPLSFSNAAILATLKCQDRPTAASVMNFINMAISVIGVLIIGALPGSPIITLPLVLLVALVLYLFFFIYSKRIV